MASRKMLHHTRTLQLDEMQCSTVLHREDPPGEPPGPCVLTLQPEVKRSVRVYWMG